VRSLNSTDLLLTIRRRASIPENQNTFSDEDLLEMASEEMFISVLPKMLELHEDFYLRSEDVDLVENVSEYTIPYRAIGDKLRDVSYIGSDGEVYEMTRIPIDDLTVYNGGFMSNEQYRTFYLKGNQVVLYPGISSNPVGSLRFHYYMSPNAITLESRVAKITAIDTVTGVLTLDKVPTNFSTSIQYDLTMKRSPHRILSIDLDASNINTTSKTITLSADDLPTELAVGDYITQAGETFYPQLPTELHSLLAQNVAIACLESMNDSEGLKLAMNKLQRMERAIPRLADNRVEASAQKVTSHRSLLRSITGRSRQFPR